MLQGNKIKTTFAVSMQGSLFISHIMKKTITFFILISLGSILQAQTIDDVFRFSQTYYQGTAKALGIGNALGAVGGDMTSICINPAGMGLYRSDELTMSLNLADRFESSIYYGTNENANKLNVSIPNFGFVKTTQKSNYKPLRYTQFCIAFNRTNDYNVKSYASGLNPNSSKIDDYLMRIDGYAPYDLQNAFPYDIYPAFNTNLIVIDSQGFYNSPIPQGGITQDFKQNYKGRAEEWSFGYSTNYYDKLFVGLSMGITHIKRIGISEFTETLPNDSDIDTDFNKWTYTEDLSSSALGVNGKIGLIWIANRWLRLGAAFHSPTIYSFDESWQTTTESQIAWVTKKTLSPLSSYEYYLFTPLKWVGCVAFVINESGMISLDAETINYGAASLYASDYDYATKNYDIKESFGRTFNIRLGTEWHINDSYLRLGAGYYGSPLGFDNPNGSIKKASVGISLPLGSISTLDLAYELSHGKQQYTLYDAGSLDIEPVTKSEFRHVAIATLKVKF